ncbi:hypothetical protein L2Y94_08920 [Luteibacter aegosomatis]|uniref:hypothetical protein n=1 Tax=Luteibacter aegosomatis TaxID=2911537 RepID=UPI001FF78F76|nr:hypothetical protein [Luteibacter aegosomatis]UPG87456.1 hypothetical protein L2Y94_08920 [Luteibacter aegosomatis]
MNTSTETSISAADVAAAHGQMDSAHDETVDYTYCVGKYDSLAAAPVSQYASKGEFDA